MSTEKYNGSLEHLKNCELARQKANIKLSCKFCSNLYSKGNIAKHETSCHQNPNNPNIKKCLHCQTNFIPKNKITETCSYACSNSHFRTGVNHGNWKQDSYRSTCFHYHKKECIICLEANIVTVHHLDENHNNNSPENLIPLCPTHHQYWHSRFKYIIEEQVLNYIENWKLEKEKGRIKK